jgi:glycosyltransferase involved in cell wall biosynthesis
MKEPDISVVMSVFNSALTLATTLESILNQEDVDLELVVIDDGSTDGSGEILSNYATLDRRLVVVDQENKGLTASLIRGCALARGEFIARQDAGGDVSLPGRFAHQISFLRAHPEAVMTACGTRVKDPEGETLYQICQHGQELQARLEETSRGGFAGPSHHGAVMFRKSAYERAGGYRDAFIVAQDIDLWSRMIEIGFCLATSDIFYESTLTKGSISQLHRGQQSKATEIVQLCMKARKEGRDDSEILDGIDIPPIYRGALSRRIQDARFYYFVGNMHRKKNNHRARTYYLEALACFPLYLRAWLGFLRSFGRSSAVGSSAQVTSREAQVTSREYVQKLVSQGEKKQCAD